MSTSFWASTLPRFILFRSSTGNHGSCELMSRYYFVLVLPDLWLLQFFHPPICESPEPWALGLIQMSHWWLCTPLMLILDTWTSLYIVHHPLHRETSLTSSKSFTNPWFDFIVPVRVKGLLNLHIVSTELLVPATLLACLFLLCLFFFNHNNNR